MNVKIMSHGGGVQTRALLHMILDGLFERPDRIIFSDTHSEPAEVYEGLELDIQAAEEAGIPFDIVSAGDLSAGVDEWGGLFIPAFTIDERGDVGMLRRQCTGRFKIQPIRRHLRSLGVKKAEVWMGISTDEAVRMRGADVQWITNRWPLIEMDLSRDDCLAYLNRKQLPVTKSACTFCPYRSPAEWRRLKQNPADWQAAVDYDKRIRNARPAHGPVFVHSSCLPLDEAPIEQDNNQLLLWTAECEGMCGV